MEGKKTTHTKQKLPLATRIDDDKSTSSHLSFGEIGAEASFLFLSYQAVCVMFICSYTKSALLPDSRVAPKQGALYFKRPPLWQLRGFIPRGRVYSASVFLEITSGLNVAGD